MNHADFENPSFDLIGCKMTDWEPKNHKKALRHRLKIVRTHERFTLESRNCDFRNQH